MKTLRTTVVALCWLGLTAALAQHAPESVSVRLVTASRDAGTADPRLQDVLPLLQNLGLKSFRLEGEASLTFRNGAAATLGKGYRLELAEVQGRNAMVRVSQNQRDLVRTRLALREDKPVTWVFDDPAGGKVIVVLKAR